MTEKYNLKLNGEVIYFYYPLINDLSQRYYEFIILYNDLYYLINWNFEQLHEHGYKTIEELISHHISDETYLTKLNK